MLLTGCRTLNSSGLRRGWDHELVCCCLCGQMVEPGRGKLGCFIVFLQFCFRVVSVSDFVCSIAMFQWLHLALTISTCWTICCCFYTCSV